MAAKVTIKGLDHLESKIRTTFDSIRKDPELLNQIALASKDNIIGYAKTGKNPETNSTFPALSKSWIDKRDYLKKFNAVDPLFLDSRKSNITFTGTLLKSIIAKIKPSDASVIVQATGDHPGYKTRKKPTKSISNEKLVGFLEEKGFIFLRVSDKLRTRINVITKAFVRRIIRKGK